MPMERAQIAVENEASELQKQFGVRVRQYRLAADLSQEELALRAGLDRSFVGQVERGERNLSLSNIHKIAEGLAIDPALLIARPR